MNIIIILISVSLSIAIGFLILFIWNVRSGQYDDVDSPSFRMLFENRAKRPETEKMPGAEEPDKTQVSS